MLICNYSLIFSSITQNLRYYFEVQAKEFIPKPKQQETGTCSFLYIIRGQNINLLLFVYYLFVRIHIFSMLLYT